MGTYRNNSRKNRKEEKISSKCLTEKLLSKMLTCPKRCNRTLWIVLPRPWKSTILRKILPPISKRSLTKNTIPPGIALLVVTLGPTSLMKPDTLSTFIWVKLPSFYSRAARKKQQQKEPQLMISKSQFESKEQSIPALMCPKKRKITQN